jgi:hypothetical protein
MTPKEKAVELVDKYSFIEIAYYTSIWEVKQGAYIAIDEIIEEHLFDGTNSYVQKRVDYWEEVKQEIENL